MASERRGLLPTVLVALGAAALVLPFLPGEWPNPLPQGALDARGGVRPLQAAAAAVDAACERGDLAAFRAATTEAHRDRLARRLAAVDLGLDGATLRAMAAAGRADWLGFPLLAGEVRGARAVVAVARPQGDGAQVLAFVWDGRSLRFDGSHHAVTAQGRAAAAAAVADAFVDRGR